MIELPTPSGYRKAVPVHARPLPQTLEGRRVERRRWIAGLSVAVVFHALLIIGWWMTPPLKLKTNPDPQRWVPVVLVPRVQPQPPAPAAASAAQPEPVKPKSKAPRNAHKKPAVAAPFEQQPATSGP